MTDNSRLLDAPAFYDSLAVDYDKMTEFEKRFIKEKPYYRLLVERFKINSALDAGCGTGFHSILLSKLGVEVTAIDVSGKMIRILGKNARKLHSKIKTYQVSLLDIPELMTASFDGVFCLGNTLPHLLKPAELRKALRSFMNILKPKGILIIQILNYDRILTRREEIQNINIAGNYSLVRSYQYTDKKIYFNIEKIRTNSGSSKSSKQKVEIRPLLETVLRKALASAGFKTIKSFGSISMLPFDKENSKDLVIHARKKAER